jgi:CO/xanthine dehydrogenase Mo-binding subunit
MTTVMPTTREVRGIGLSVPRFDAPEKVTGRTQYVGDVRLPGLLQARLLRSPHAHARIKRIDVSKARALPGVRTVLTAADIPELKPGAKTRAHALLAIDRVVFFGQLWPPSRPTTWPSPTRRSISSTSSTNRSPSRPIRSRPWIFQRPEWPISALRQTPAKLGRIRA